MCQGLLAYQHADGGGLLALKASICGVDCPALASWNETSHVCSPVGFDGVYCALQNGEWRVVSVTLQLEVSTVSLDDAQLSAGGALQGIEYLRELELLCYKDPMAGIDTCLLAYACLSSAPSSVLRWYKVFWFMHGLLMKSKHQHMMLSFRLIHHNLSVLRCWTNITKHVMVLSQNTGSSYCGCQQPAMAQPWTAGCSRTRNSSIQPSGPVTAAG